MKILASDLDGVIFNSAKPLRDKFELPDNIEEYYDPRVMKAFEYVKKDSVFWENIPFEAGTTYLEAPSYFITHRSDVGKISAIKTLTGVGIKTKVINTKGSKIPILKELKVTHFIEDSPENFILCNAYGIKCYLVRKSWNKEFHNHELAVDTFDEAVTKFYKEKDERQNNQNQEIIYRFELSDYGKGKKNDQAKIRPSLIPVSYIEGTAKVFEFGAKKYDEWNWAKGISYRRLIDAAMRHLFLLSQGEDLDDESGCYHEFHASCCLAMLTQMRKLHPEMDDRPEIYKESGSINKFINE